MKKLQNKIFAICLLLFCNLYLQNSIQAKESESLRYKIENADINYYEEPTPTKPKPSPTPTITPTPKQDKTAILGIQDTNQFTEKGYVVKKNNQPIILSIDNNNLIFDDLKHNKIFSKNIIIKVEIKNSDYQTILLNNVKLPTSFNGELINNTKCNQVNKPCTVINAKKWDSILHTGYGYNLKGQYTPGDFINDLYFRPFPYDDKYSIYLTRNGKSISPINMTIQVNIPLKKPILTYESHIEILSLPAF